MKIGILTDIHENVNMLQEALRQAEVQGCDELACLGDIIGYDQRFYAYLNNRDAKACLDLVRSNCRWIVAGNHDLHAARRFPAYSNGFNYPTQWFEMKPEERKRVSRGKVWCYEAEAPHNLAEDDLDFLQSLPEYLIVPIRNMTCLFSHYLFPDTSGSTTLYMERNQQLQKHWEFLSLHKIRLSFSGHAHGHHTGFAYPVRDSIFRSYFKAFHAIASDNFKLGNEIMAIMLLPLAGEKGRTGFAVLEADSMKLNIISTGIH